MIGEVIMSVLLVQVPVTIIIARVKYTRRYTITINHTDCSGCPVPELRENAVTYVTDTIKL